MSMLDSPTYSPSDSASMSEVPTEPLNASEKQMMHDYMSRRQHFLSDYERYNPVQNMHTLANHVFDLTENIFRLKTDFQSSRRVIDIVSTNQREENESIRVMGEDLGELKQEMDQFRRETQQGLDEIKSMIGAITSVMMQGKMSQ
ncbi:hypothetical protein EDC01DRAFT_782818 [Geopyxis carbonaria]|nr:hypothetical protein EDC01DRAFT_782818 [Geopyxis carbonaria]